MNREAPPLTPSQARAAYEFMMVAGWRGHAADEWRHTARLLADAALAPNVSAGVGRSLLDPAPAGPPPAGGVGGAGGRVTAAATLLPLVDPHPERKKKPPVPVRRAPPPPGRLHPNGGA